MCVCMYVVCVLVRECVCRSGVCVDFLCHINEKFFCKACCEYFLQSSFNTYTIVDVIKKMITYSPKILHRMGKRNSSIPGETVTEQSQMEGGFPQHAWYHAVHNLWLFICLFDSQTPHPNQDIIQR